MPAIHFDDEATAAGRAARFGSNAIGCRWPVLLNFAFSTTKCSSNLFTDAVAAGAFICYLHTPMPPILIRLISQESGRWCALATGTSHDKYSTGQLTPRAGRRIAYRGRRRVRRESSAPTLESPARRGSGRMPRSFSSSILKWRQASTAHEVYRQGRRRRCSRRAVAFDARADAAACAAKPARRRC